MPNVRAGIATVANWRCSGVSEGGRVTLISLREADAERLMDPGERLLGDVVATHRCASFWVVSRADRYRRAEDAVVPAIGRNLAGSSGAKRMAGDGMMNG
jgi:hypothetical protein